MTLWVATGLGCLGSYLLGGVPIGVIAGRLKGINILKVGSGNIGAANVGRLFGLRWGLAVFALDVLKGFLPTLLADYFLLDPTSGTAPAEEWRYVCWLMIGLFAVLGHNYSPYLGFRGGKGVATSFGAALGVYPHLTYPALIALTAWGLMVGMTRISSAGSITAAVVFPVAYTVLAAVDGWDKVPRWPFLSFTLLATVMVMVRHRANIARLLKGTEARLVRYPANGTESSKVRV